MKARIAVGDITTFSGDAIVNAANPPMLGGGGVDGAIHRAAGPGLVEACRQVWADEDGVRCPVGQVRPTPAFDLPCKWVFHTVGPIFDLQRSGPLRPGESTASFVATPKSSLAGCQPKVAAFKIDKEQQLRDCFKFSMVLAVAMGLESIAFPAISTGVYGCPHETCAAVAAKFVKDHVDWPLAVTFFIHPAEHYSVWVQAFRDAGIDVLG